MRLNLGSGPRPVPGWINIDRPPGIYLDRVRAVKHALHRLGVLSEGHLTPWSRLIVRHDIRRPLPYPDRSAEAMLAHSDTRPRGAKRIAAWLSGSVHRWQPVPSMVERLLRDAGFAAVRRCGYREGSLPDLELVEDRPNSFFVEAVPAGGHMKRSTECG